VNARAENHARNEPYTKCNAFVTSIHRNPQPTKKCNAFVNARARADDRNPFVIDRHRNPATSRRARVHET